MITTVDQKGIFILLLSVQYLSTADFAMREELSLKAAILAEKFAPDLSWYESVCIFVLTKSFHGFNSVLALIGLECGSADVLLLL